MEVVNPGTEDCTEVVVLTEDRWEVAGTVAKLLKVEEDQLLVLTCPEVVD